jgi:hypothetical protein
MKFNMFKNASSLKTTQMFKGSGIETIDFTNTNVDYITDAGEMFCNCVNLVNIQGAENFSFKDVINVDNMFSNCTNYKGPILNLMTSTYVFFGSTYGMYYNCTNLIGDPDEVIEIPRYVSTMENMFCNCSNFFGCITSSINKCS